MAQPRVAAPPFSRWAVLAVILLVLGVLLYVLRGVLTPIFFGFLIAYMLDPVVDWFEARRMPRAVGIAVMLTVVSGAAALFILLALPEIIADIASFLGELPHHLEDSLRSLEPWLAKYGIRVPQSFDEALERFGVDSQQLAEVIAPAGAAVGWVVGGTASVLAAMVGVVLVPVFAAYLLHDFDRITAAATDLVPRRWRAHVVDVAREIDEVLSAFIRGQLLVMLALAVLYSTAYALLGVELALVIGIVAGLLSFIPYVGGAVALGLAVVMCLLDWQGLWQLGGVVVAYALIQVLEGFVITPRIIGDKVGLSAIWVLFALLVGADLFGFLGVLVALPAAAVAKIFVLRGLALYRRSSFYCGESGHAPLDPTQLLLEEGLPDDLGTKRAKYADEHEIERD